MLAVGMLRGKKGVRSFAIPKPDIKEPDDVLVRVKEVGLDGTDFNMVRYNLQDIVGSVNSNRRHFERALEDMGDLNSRFNGMLEKMITHRFKLEDYEAAFALDDPTHIKTVIEVEPW
ncbi:MAG: hypothetical protein V1771_05785 [Chloroflexota bacterium]